MIKCFSDTKFQVVNTAIVGPPTYVARLLQKLFANVLINKSWSEVDNRYNFLMKANI